MALFGTKKTMMVDPADALAGRDTEMPVPDAHFVNGNPLKPPFPEGMQQIMVGMGCFWGAERVFWQVPGVFTTAVGYAAGFTPNPTYEEVCSGRTGHTEAVLAVFDPEAADYAQMLALFWENHDPTQGMRQGNDVGTQYRSGIYCSTEHHLQLATASRVQYAAQLRAAGLGDITTEIQMAPDYYLAEDYHQQYLAKVPGGYCSMRGTGVVCPPEEPAP